MFLPQIFKFLSQIQVCHYIVACHCKCRKKSGNFAEEVKLLTDEEYASKGMVKHCTDYRIKHFGSRVEKLGPVWMVRLGLPLTQGFHLFRM